MEDNKIKQILNQIETPDFLEEDLLNVKRKDESKWSVKSMKGWTKIAAAIVIVLTVGTGVVYAAEQFFGLSFFLKNMSDEGQQYINTEVQIEETKDNLEKAVPEDLKDLVTFKVKESVADSYSCHIAVEATLSDTDNYFMVPAEYEVEKSEENCVLASTYYNDALENESIKEYADRIGKEMLLVDSFLSPEQCLDGYTGSMEPGVVIGKNRVLLYMEVYKEDSGVRMENGMELELNNLVSTYNPKEKTWQECKNEIMTAVVSEVAPDEEKAHYAFTSGEDMRVEDSTIIIKDIILTKTAIETKVAFKVVNEDKEMGNWISINLIDDEGNILERGVANGGSSSVPDANGAFTENKTYIKMELPDTINIRVRNLDTDEIYEIKGIPRAQ